MQIMKYKVLLALCWFAVFIGTIEATVEEGSGSIECENGGTPSQLTEQCECVGGFNGQFCENNACLNGGTYNDADAGCDCLSGYVGDNCGIINPCSFGTYMDDGHCECDPGYKGVSCSEEKCLNGGTFIDDATGCACPDGFVGAACMINDPCMYGTYKPDGQCKCDPGYKGDTCDEEICLNGGSFIDDATGCDCPDGFVGADCTINDPCMYGTYKPDGQCECDPGYKGDTCDEEKCLNGGSFIDDATGCACPDGFVGADCTINDPCMYGSYKPDGQCECDPGYKGDICDEVKPCVHGNYVDTVCECDPGFQGESCDEDFCQNGGTFVDADSDCNCPPPYTGNDCTNMKPCVHGNNVDAVCECDPGFQGESCDEDFCQNGGTFVDADSDCNCPRPYTGNDCTNMKPCVHGNYVDAVCECDAGFQGESCDQAVCVNGIEQEDGACECYSGYHGTSCESAMCLNGGSFIPDFGCYCQPGYHGADCGEVDPCVNGYWSDDHCACPVGYNGEFCENKIEDPGELCANGGVLDPTTNECNCAEGFRGKHCEFVKNAACEHGGTYDADYDYCYCPSGYGGQHCEFADPCSCYPCLNYGCCMNQDHGFLCICSPGYSGDVCQTKETCDIGKFSLIAIKKENIMPYCYQTTYYDDKATAQDCMMAGCDDNGNTVEFLDGECWVYLCNEENGQWEWSTYDPGSDVYRITAFNPCDGVTCSGNGQCVVVQGPLDNLSDLQFQCRCDEGYDGLLCAGTFDACASSPCADGATCIPTEEGAACQCPQLRFGPLCGLWEPPYKYIINFIITSISYVTAFGDRDTPQHQTLCESVWTQITAPFGDRIPPFHECTFESGSVITSILFGTSAPLDYEYIYAKIFEALQQADFEIAEDSLKIKPPTDVFTCNFEEGFCSMAQVSNDDFDWTRASGETPTYDTGPYGAYNGDLYAYAKAWGQMPGDNAKLRFTIETMEPEVCLKFAVSMHGAEMGSLALHQVNDDGDAQVIWREGYYDIEYWESTSFKVQLSKGKKMLFTATIGEGDRSDIAIDDIVVSTNLDECYDNSFDDDGDCKWTDMGPHLPKCLDIIWGWRCLPEGTASKEGIYNEFFSTLTLNAVDYIIINIMEKAIKGLEPWKSQCYGHDHNYLRLVGGPDNTTGRVEVYAYGSWGTICDDLFDDVDATVICKNLGYESGVARPSAEFGQGEGSIYFGDLQCVGTEETFLTCNRTNWIDCYHDEDVTVKCIQGASGATDIVGWEPVEQPETDETEGAVFIFDLGTAVKKNGKVSEWQFYTAYVTTMAFQVWRFVRYSLSSELFMLVGQAYVNTTYGVNSFKLEPENYIQVEAGDVLGVYFPQGNSLTYTSEVCFSPDQRLRFNPDPPYMTLNVEMDVQVAALSWDPCRVYSVRAIIQNDPDLPPTLPPTTPRPEADPSAVFFCSFEDDLCGIEVKQSDDAVWERHNGDTPTYGTGPTIAINGGYYMFVESSNMEAATETGLILPEIADGSTVACLKFMYHMHGSGMGKLTVSLLENSGGIKPLWFQSGHQGSEWISTQITIGNVKNSRIAFTSKVGTNSLSDMAVDAIEIIPGQCPIIITTTPPPEASTIATSTISPQLLAKTYYISNNGTDTEGCGSKENHCATVGYAVSGPELSKTINILSADKPFPVNFGRHQDTNKIFISSNLMNKPVVIITDKLEHPKRLTHLNLTGVDVVGPINLDCEGGNLALNLINVTFLKESENHVMANNCDSLTVLMHSINIKMPTVYFKALSSSSIKLSNVTLTGMTEADVVNASISRSKRDTTIDLPDTGGMFVHYKNKDGKHSLDVVESTFLGLKSVTSKILPSAALMVYMQKTGTDLKAKIYNCSFVNNHRAIDLSLKGRPDIRIANTSFHNNSAAGSGGALRFTATLSAGFGTVSTVQKTLISITNCTFMHNFANHTDYYLPGDLYFQTRYPGSGGAIYVFVVARSQLHHDGFVSIKNSTFHSNTATMQGGTIFVNPDISTEICNTSFTNYQGSYRPKVGDLIHASCNMTLDGVDFGVTDTDSSSAVISYQASDPSNSRLLVRNMSLFCPESHRLEQLNTSSLASSIGLETLQMYCRICPEEQYSLNTTTVHLHENQEDRYNDVRCVKCPYGARCTVGIKNNQGFWGSTSEGNEVVMYQCPQEYCEQESDSRIAFDSCKEHRTGILCGRCEPNFSESMFNTDCISNDDCGWKTNYWVLLLIASYGILYLLFFLFETDYDRFQNYLREKLSVEKEKQEDPDETAAADARSKEGSEEEFDVSKTGYFQIVMYFVQTTELLQVRMLMEGDWPRPKDLLPDLFIEWVGTVLSFDAFALNFGACLFTDMMPVMKTVIKIIYVLYIFGLLFFIYVVSGCCCFWMKAKDRPKIGPQVGMNARILMTLVSLLLYTYASVAEYAFQLLNCVTVNGERVLFYDGNVPCMQSWQYGVIAFVVIFVVPFFIVLLFGPKLLANGDITLGFFFLSLFLPFFMAVPLILWYFKIIKPRPKSESEEEYKGVAVFCRGENEELTSEIVDQVAGVYRENLWGGVCWEGIMNLRRLVMVVFYTFLTDMLIRQMMMSFACFVILILHVKVNPFYLERSNLVEFISLSILLIISGMNMIKSAFLQAQAFPTGNVYRILIIYEWTEVIFLSVLPLLLILVLIVALIILAIRKYCCMPMKSSLQNRQSSVPQQTNGYLRHRDFSNFHGNNREQHEYHENPIMRPRPRAVEPSQHLPPNYIESQRQFFYDRPPSVDSRDAYLLNRLPSSENRIMWRNKAESITNWAPQPSEQQSSSKRLTRYDWAETN